MRRADHIIDLGPRAGVHGGEVVAQGTLRDIEQDADFRDRPLPADRRFVIRCAKTRRSLGEVEQWIEIRGAHANNLEECRCAFSGRPAVGHHRHFRFRKIDLMRRRPAAGGARAIESKRKRGDGELFKLVSGAEAIEAVYEVDQSPIGKTSRSTPATYIKVFDEIRNLYAQMPVSRVRGYSAEPLFVQHRRRPLRNVRRPGRDQAGDEFSAEQLRAVRRLRRQTLQPANARSSLQRKIDRRRDGDDDRAGGGIFCRESRRSRARFRCSSIPVSVISNSGSRVRP